MKEKMTPWFPAGSKAERTGVYKTIPSAMRTFQFWNGKKWLFCSSDPDRAAMAKGVSAFQNPKWLGLASNPSKEKS